MDVPNCISMFIKRLSILGNGSVRFFTDVINGYSAVLGTTGYEIGVFDAEFAGGEGELTGEYFLREGGVF